MKISSEKSAIAKSVKIAKSATKAKEILHVNPAPFPSRTTVPVPAVQATLDMAGNQQLLG